MLASSLCVRRPYPYAMHEHSPQRLTHCSNCSRPAAGEGDHCIFCGTSLLRETVRDWRSVYHPYSYPDALLAHSALLAHGVTTRLKHSNMERVLLGHIGAVIQVAEGDHLYAQEVVRKLRGVRTDTEYLEWQELKRRKALHRKLLIGAVAAAAAALAATLTWGLTAEARPGMLRQGDSSAVPR